MGEVVAACGFGEGVEGSADGVPRGVLGAAGASVLYLPSYSPNLNPIENVYRGNL